MKPLQLPGSAYRPSLTEQSTSLQPSNPDGVVDDVGTGVGGVGGGVDGLEGVDVQGPPLLVPVSM